MHARLTLFVALVASFISGTSIAAEPAGAEYYPLNVGNEWRYHFDASGHKSTLESRVAKQEEIDGVTMDLIEAEVDGQVAATEHLRVTDEGIFRCRYNGSEVTPPVCVLRFPIKDGDSWESENRIGQERFHVRSTVSREEVEVPQGKYDAVKVVVATAQNGQAVTSTYWFAPGVGNVKQAMDFGDRKITFELIEYKPGE